MSLSFVFVLVSAQTVCGRWLRWYQCYSVVDPVAHDQIDDYVDVDVDGCAGVTDCDDIDGAECADVEAPGTGFTCECSGGYAVEDGFCVGMVRL